MLRKHIALWISALVVALVLIPLALGAGSNVAAARAMLAPTPTVSAITALTVAPSVANDGTLTLTELYQRVNSSVVEVVSLAQSGRSSTVPVEQGLGSGFVWDTQGRIVTNDHVVEGADALQVVFLGRHAGGSHARGHRSEQRSGRDQGGPHARNAATRRAG